MTVFTNITDTIQQYPPWQAVAAIVLFGGLLPALGEELFFRGFLGRGLVARWGPVRGVLLTSLLFGAMHLHPVQATMAAVLGVVLHAVYLWTRSLVAPMVLHAVYNCQVFLINVYAPSIWPDLPDAEHLPLCLALTATAATFGLLALLYRSRVRWVREDGSDWSPGFPSGETPPSSAAARLSEQRPGSVLVVFVAVVYLLFVATLGWELRQ